MGYRFEFDAVNKILMVRIEGPLTDELLVKSLQAIQRYSAATVPRAGIADLSSVNEFSVSSKILSEAAQREPAFGSIPRIIVAPTTVGFGLSRMFQVMGSTTPGLEVVRTMDEAFAKLGVQSPHFEPLD